MQIQTGEKNQVVKQLPKSIPDTGNSKLKGPKCELALPVWGVITRTEWSESEGGQWEICLKRTKSQGIKTRFLPSTNRGRMVSFIFYRLVLSESTGGVGGQKKRMNEFYIYNKPKLFKRTEMLNGWTWKLSASILPFPCGPALWRVLVDSLGHPNKDLTCCCVLIRKSHGRRSTGSLCSALKTD